MMDFLHISAFQKHSLLCWFYISYPSPSSLCPLVRFPPSSSPLRYLSFIPRRSTADNLCGHSWAPCLASVCLSSYSFTVGFWRSYCFVPAQIISVQKPLFIHSETHWEQAVFYRRNLSDTGSSKTAIKPDRHPSALFWNFFVCWIWFVYAFFLKKTFKLCKVLSLLILVWGCFSSKLSLCVM